MLQLKNIHTLLGDFSLKDINLDIQRGDYFILLGVSGAGKSIILETIAGLLTPDSGSIILDGEDITRKKIQQRSIGIVFQDHAVFPHMTVYNNIVYSLHGKNLSSTDKEDRIKTIAAQMNIGSLLNRQPATLSGGELQRVALARTLVQQPKILLLDEPLAAMDVQLKSELRSLLRQINRNGQTIIHVSHNYEEAVSLGNKIAVIHNGTILQQGGIEDVLQNPVSEFVAHFTGAKNFYPVTHLTTDSAGEYKLNSEVKVRIETQNHSEKGFIMLRNEDITLTDRHLHNSDYNSLKGEIIELVKLPCGVEALINVGVPVYVTVPHENVKQMELKEKSVVWVNFRITSVRFLRA